MSLYLSVGLKEEVDFSASFEWLIRFYQVYLGGNAMFALDAIPGSEPCALDAIPGSEPCGSEPCICWIY